VREPTLPFSKYFMPINMIKLFQRQYKKLSYFVLTLYFSLFTVKVFADSDDPFPSINTNNSGDIVQAAGSHLEMALKYSLIGAGGILIIISLAALVHRIREDNKEKDHGNLVTTFILLALGLTFGFILIGLGWTAFSTNIQS
jgi:hypothetical protein